MYEIYYELDKNKEKEYKAYLNKIKKYPLLQTPEWVIMKPEWKSAFIILKSSNEIKGVCLVLIRKVPLINGSILYAPRGPIIEDVELIPDFIKAIKDLAKKEKAFIFKADPAETDNQLFSEYFKIKSDYKNFEGIQPRFESVLILEDKINLEDLINSFSGKTRYNIRLAQRKGIQVTEVRKENLNLNLDSFYKLMQETGQRDNFTIRNKEYFRKLLTDLNMTENNTKLYMATYNNTPVAGAIIIKNGDSVEYLYGASSNEHRNTMATYLLQWTAIKDAFEKGCRSYSFGGISGDMSEDNPLYGLYKFKSGFGTNVVEYIGEIEIVFNRVKNLCFNILNRIRKNCNFLKILLK